MTNKEKQPQIYTYFASPIGEITLTSDENSITGLYIEHDKRLKKMADLDFEYQPKHRAFKQCLKQIEEYFKGDRKKFNLKISFTGTEFQEKIWNLLEKIPYGETTSYKYLSQTAKMEESWQSWRVTGKIVGQNPLSIIIPCHRVVGTNGKLLGYSGGLEAKKFLLEHEKNIKQIS